jgi:hypothetical protein
MATSWREGYGRCGLPKDGRSEKLSILLDDEDLFLLEITLQTSHVQTAPMWDRVFGIETILLAVAFVA